MLHPALGDDPSKFNSELVPGIGYKLKQKADGSCCYLVERGCSIWPKTPGVCRAFDCRVYARSEWAKLDPLRNEVVIQAGLDRIDAVHQVP